MKHTFGILFLFFIASVSAQNIDDIRNNPSYYFAEGEGITIEEAERSAMERIVNSIQVSVSTERTRTSTQISDTSGDTYSETVSAKVNVSSFITLKNINTRIISEEPNAKVVRWISKEEVESIFKERSQKAVDYVETGKRAEQQLQIDDALRNYYWALVLSQTNRDPVYAEFNGKEENCEVFLPSKIKSVIANVKCNLTECASKDNRYLGKMHFTYYDRDVASLQLRYNDGQAFVGPVVAKDGTCELEFVSLPTDKKIQLSFEYKFMNEAEHLDNDLAQAFKHSKVPVINNAFVEVPVKVNVKNNTMKPALKPDEGVSATATAGESILPEPVKQRKRMELETVDNPDEYLQRLRIVEQAIEKKNPELAYGEFTNEGYQMFQTLLKQTGTVSLVGDKQEYTFLRANGQVLGRSCKVKLKFNNGKTFMENLTFRFNEEDKKIQSFAFALTQKAEDDIFNAATSWPEVSRYTILQFMEDYQTAYALKRLDYISTLFSEGALIISGTVLKPISNTAVQEGRKLDLNQDEIKYSIMNKQQYITKLTRHFKEREYIHLTFEDNITKIINAKRIPYGTAFAIQIKQYYNSPSYSDKGYLTLVLDTSEKQPIIHVRLWQPDKKEMMSVEEFINKFNF